MPDLAPTLTIDLSAVQANYRTLARAVAPAECAAVVKADGYGLGAAPIARALEKAGCRTFFVATFAEGAALRSALPRARIFVFEGPSHATEAGFLAQRLSPVLNSVSQIDLWRDLQGTQSSRLPPAAIQIDTGMARLGLSPEEVRELAADPARLGPAPPAFVMSHLACAEDPSSPLNRSQRERFDALRALLPPAPASLANSAGCRLGPAFHYDLVRPGIALFGGYAEPGGPTAMRTVVTAEAHIVQVRQIDRPETVGYGATHIAKGPARVATVAIGYADGYKRGLGNRGKVAIAGALVPVVGRVSMDLITVDTTSLHPDLVAPGMPVEILGASVPLDDAAAAAETIPHDVLTGLGRRFIRRYAGLEAAE